MKSHFFGGNSENASIKSTLTNQYKLYKLECILAEIKRYTSEVSKVTSLVKILRRMQV